MKAAPPPKSTTGDAAPQPPVTKKEIFGWCMYDVADSAFTTIIVTTFYSQYFSAIVVVCLSSLAVLGSNSSNTFSYTATKVGKNGS